MRRHRRRGGETKNEEKQRPRRSNVESGQRRCYGRCGACFALVYGWFTEGFDTLDLKEAKALLDELAS
jgi:predicted ATPase